MAAALFRIPRSTVVLRRLYLNKAPQIYTFTKVTACALARDSKPRESSKSHRLCVMAVGSTQPLIEMSRLQLKCDGMRLSRARRAQLKGRSYAEVLSVDFTICHYFPFGYRPGIRCREWVEGCGGGTNSLPEG